MRYLIALEPLENGFSVQVPDLAIVTHGKDIQDAKRAAIEAIRVNINTYYEIGKKYLKKDLYQSILKIRIFLIYYLLL